MSNAYLVANLDFTGIRPRSSARLGRDRIPMNNLCASLLISFFVLELFALAATAFCLRVTLLCTTLCTIHVCLTL